MAYATIADVRNAQSVMANDADIQVALDHASASVDAKTGRKWGQAISTRTVDDVRTDAIVVGPVASVTELRVGASVISPGAYEVRPWGIRLRGGAFWWGGVSGTISGATVTITGNFGEATPELVKEATILLAIDRLGGTTTTTTTTDSAIPDLPSNVRSFSVEGLSVAFADSGTTTVGNGTGNDEADRLLALLSQDTGGVV